MTCAPPSRLLERHLGIEQSFLDHQEALLDRDPVAARRALALHRQLLVAHVAEEDQVVLAFYDTLGPAPRGGSADLLRAEHAKILEWLDRLDELLETYERLKSPLPRDLIALLDREATFKHLMEHHDLRERKYLYPALDEALGPAQREELWRRLEAKADSRR